MTDWKSGGGIKVKRAKEHIDNLQTEFTAFDQRSPLRLGAIAGDALHNLRSALDHLWRIVWPGCVRDKNRRDTFPIYETADGVIEAFSRANLFR